VVEGHSDIASEPMLSTGEVQHQVHGSNKDAVSAGSMIVIFVSRPAGQNIWCMCSEVTMTHACGSLLEVVLLTHCQQLAFVVVSNTISKGVRTHQAFGVHLTFVHHHAKLVCLCASVWVNVRAVDLPVDEPFLNFRSFEVQGVWVECTECFPHAVRPMLAESVVVGLNIWSCQLHCRAWVFLSSCSRSGQQSQNPPAILFPTSLENRTRQPASCAQQVSAGHCHTQCAKESRCPPCKEHALTLTAAPVDSNWAAGEASLSESKQVEDNCTPWRSALAGVCALPATSVTKSGPTHLCGPAARADCAFRRRRPAVPVATQGQLPARPSHSGKVWYLFEIEPIETLRKRKTVVLRNLNVSFQGVKETSNTP